MKDRRQENIKLHFQSAERKWFTQEQSLKKKGEIMRFFMRKKNNPGSLQPSLKKNSKRCTLGKRNIIFSCSFEGISDSNKNEGKAR